MEVNPIAIILVYLDSKGDRLLYRYPYQQQQNGGTDKSLLLGTTTTTATTTITTTNTIMNVSATVPHVDSSSSIISIGSTKFTGENATTATNKRGRFALQNADDLLQTPPVLEKNTNKGNIKIGQMEGFADEVLAPLFAVKPELCNQKFELKINDVRFVSHPTLIQRREQRSSIGGGITQTTGPNLSVNPISTITGTTLHQIVNINQQQQQQNLLGLSGQSSNINTINSSQRPQIQQQMLVNIVFALQAQASYSIVKCYYDLSRRLSLTLKVEEQRNGYLSDETAIMARTHDEVASQQQPLERAFDLISDRCTLAQSIKSIYHDLCTVGLLNVTINQNLTVSFCLPARAHQLHKKNSIVNPETIDACLRALKPYHGMLLLVDFAELLDCVPPAGARMLLQFIDVYTPFMSLQNMASEADLTLEHVYKLVSHLVYWAKATIIYPLCETNVYVIAPEASLHTKSHLVEKFATRFPGMSLFEVISNFSLPTSIGHLTTPLQQSARQGILAQTVLWMLQHHLLVQLHTYVQFMPSYLDDREGDAMDNGYAGDDGYCDVHNDGDGERDVIMEMSSLDIGLGLGGTSGIGPDELIFTVGRASNTSDDDLGGSLLSLSSQPLPVPLASSHRSIIEERCYSGADSTTSENLAAQPSSSHKSNFSMTASLSTDNCDSIASIEDEEKIKELLQVFDEMDRFAIRRIPASGNLDDLTLMVKLYQAGYFKSEHHLEEIMYFENLRRSQLLQLLDKFRDVLIIYETEDSAIALMYNQTNTPEELC